MNGKRRRAQKNGTTGGTTPAKATNGRGVRHESLAPVPTGSWVNSAPGLSGRFRDGSRPGKNPFRVSTLARPKVPGKTCSTWAF